MDQKFKYSSIYPTEDKYFNVLLSSINHVKSSTEHVDVAVKFEKYCILEVPGSNLGQVIGYHKMFCSFPQAVEANTVTVRLNRPQPLSSKYIFS
jgi:hypothetical protein